MVRHFNLKTDAEKYVGQHFKVKEFRSYSSTYNRLFSDEVLIMDELVNKLEELRSALNCSITIINGYRCKAHNRAVGGSSGSSHLFGWAADIRCLDEKSQPVNGKLVCCKAQDLGFKGIGYMNNNAVHLDMSPNRKWYGDETRKENGTYYSLTKHGTDFYKYFGITKETEKPKNVIELPSYWAADSWNEAVQNNITDGSNPKSYVTREQAITMILRFKTGKQYTIDNACAYAFERGYTDGSNLKNNATKEQCCALIYRIMQGVSKATINESVKYCIDNGIIKGDGENLNLKGYCQRQELIVMLYRF